MKKFNKICLLAGLAVAFNVLACGNGDKGNETQSTDENGHGKTGEDIDDGSYKFPVELIEAEYYDSASEQKAYWGIKAYTTKFNVDDEGYRVAQKSPFAGLDFWQDTAYGSAYPFEAGVITLGDSSSEQNYMTCSKCLVLGTEMTEKGGKNHLAVSGTITINTFENGKLNAVLDNVVFKEFEEKWEMGPKGYDIMTGAPLIDGGEELVIKHLELVDNTKENVYAVDCDNVYEALDAYACANALGIAVSVKK